MIVELDEPILDDMVKGQLPYDGPPRNYLMTKTPSAKLFAAARAGHYNVVKKISTNSQQDDLDEALWHAAGAGKLKCVKALLMQKASPDYQNGEAFRYAVNGGSLACVKEMYPYHLDSESIARAIATSVDNEPVRKDCFDWLMAQQGVKKYLTDYPHHAETCIVGNNGVSIRENIATLVASMLDRAVMDDIFRNVYDGVLGGDDHNLVVLDNLIYNQHATLSLTQISNDMGHARFIKCTRAYAMWEKQQMQNAVPPSGGGQHLKRTRL